MQIASIGIDSGKTSFHLVALNEPCSCTESRAVSFRVKYDTGRLGKWVHELMARAPRNKVIVAIANNLARIAWAVLSRGEQYRPAPVIAQTSPRALEKTLRLGKRCRVSHFSTAAPATGSTTKFQRGLLRQSEETTVERPAGKPE